MTRRKGFFATAPRVEDDLARERDLAALVHAPRTIVQDIGVERIYPNPFQARQSFDDLDNLAQTIRMQGFTTRLRVRPHPSEPNMFQLVYGERRLRAARLAGLTHLPCDIADHSDADLIEIGLAENIQRRDLDPLDEARALQTFVEQRGYSVRRLAERIGKDKSYVEDRLALLRMPADVQEMVEQRTDTLRAAREIAKVTAPKVRQPLIRDVVAGVLSTAAVREAVRDLTDTAQEGAATTALQPAQGSAAADPQRTMHRRIARDTHAIRTILSRWEQGIARGEAERTSVGRALDELMSELERLIQLLAEPTP